ncbi:MAG: hypothetical protein A2287_03645 [Candidatus Melainabacteria bacterium RIFOXYA12_FULL_32_12]|nr:MAG: hypothetical protein A2255_05940 [Candidatus Melainabacteria bacterium RIFOXYA2_FULL_32_9]OGI24172.1 MAG: hypothetical protein A2287_03645 [Candidatus Melainabacteria bacterium RIFOXYA12_FULL_32_12]
MFSETKQSKLAKAGYRWVKVSELYNETPPLGSNCDIKDKFPGYEGLWCKLIMSVTSYAMINNAVAVIHGPSNCGWAVRNFTSTDYSLYYGNPFLYMPCTNIDENAVISGGNESLIKTLIEVDRDYNPEHICVFDTCSTALIADDIELAINTAQKDCKAKINYIPAAGFTAPPLGKAIEECSVKYANLMETPDTILKDSVNILGQYKENFCVKRMQKRGKYPDDATELVRYIEALNLKLHRVIVSGNYDYIKTAPQAKVNVISCPTWGFPLAQKMEEKFGTPYLKHAIPIGIEATSKWINELADFMNRQEEAETLIKQETDKLTSIYDEVKKLAQGKIALIECGRNSQTAFARPMALARMLKEIGMTPYLFGLHPLELKAKAMDLNYFLWDEFDPQILAGNYAYQQPININHVIEDLGFDQDQYVYFTEDVFPMARSGMLDACDTPRVETGVHLRRVINSPGRGVGFRGAQALAKNIIEAILAAKRGTKPTLYGRVHGNFWEFTK